MTNIFSDFNFLLKHECETILVHCMTQTLQNIIRGGDVNSSFNFVVSNLIFFFQVQLWDTLTKIYPLNRHVVRYWRGRGKPWNSTFITVALLHMQMIHSKNTFFYVRFTFYSIYKEIHSTFCICHWICSHLLFLLSLLHNRLFAWREFWRRKKVALKKTSVGW